MILIDSLYINNSGGKVLLDYLVEELEQSGLEVFYLFDDRCKDDFKKVPKEKKQFLKASLYNRYRFYKKNKDLFTTVFCFGNLATPFKLQSKVFTYFHQPLFLNIPDSIGFKQKLLLKLKTYIFNRFSKNSDFFLVQSDTIKEKLNEVHKIPTNEINVLPFYPPLKGDREALSRIKNSFVYISNASSHKNHERLMEAFCVFYDRHKKGQLTVTVSASFNALYADIEAKVAQGYPIVNIGLVVRNKLVKYYQESEYLIFPSLAESFGLGLVEAIENGCDVIGADLPYTYAVCEPSLVFNPYDVGSIVTALETALKDKVKPTKQLLFNEIDSIINLFKEDENKK